jgi:cellobiose phosphorylase
MLRQPMPDPRPPSPGPAPAPPLRARLTGHGSLRQLACDDIHLTLFPATELETPLPGLVLRCHAADGVVTPVPFLGPDAPGRLVSLAGRRLMVGRWNQVAWCAELVLAADAAAWFWHVQLKHLGGPALRLDLLMLQDLALAPWGAIRLNEAYVSQYIDHQPLDDVRQGVLVASRQNQPVEGRHPWLLFGSLGRAVGLATDALQLLGQARRERRDGSRLHLPLPAQRLQHEHSVVALQDEALTLAPGQQLQRGFFGWFEPDHPAASGPADLDRLARVRALPEWQWAPPPGVFDTATPVLPAEGPAAAASLFSRAPLWPAEPPDEAALAGWLGEPATRWRQVERAGDGTLLSCFVGRQRHLVTRAKEWQVQRPHGHMMRSGTHWTPDEAGVASTAWMAGVFHSSVTQGHASANRCLSTQRGWLGLYRGQGQRIFVDEGAGWQLLDEPSAFEMDVRSARWFYARGGRLIVVSAEADAHAPELRLRLAVQGGAPLRVLVAHQVALNGDDGLAEGPLHWAIDAGVLRVRPAPGSEMHQRFGERGFSLRAEGLPWCQAGGDALLFEDGHSRGQPSLCLLWAPTLAVELVLRCELVDAGAAAPGTAAAVAFDTLASAGLALHPARADAAGLALARLHDIAPWWVHNALVHYLSPRGLEQFSGGGWGTRDVCQGPAEWLLALGRFDALRDLLCRVFAAQNADGDWPQWFMFYPRDAAVRAGDSHGDIVFWPVLALADYLHASGDATLLTEPLPFHTSAGQPADVAPLAEHLARAIGLMRRRTVAGTRLAAYGHGDWNDALQPADPAKRDQLCSAWTVTLHVRTLRHLAAAWQRLGRAAEAAALQAWAAEVQADFQRLLLADDVLAGYTDFGSVPPRHLLHPRDTATGIRYSALAMVHAIIDELFTPEQAARHAALIAQHLTGPDGLRLFDRPLRYTGGTMRLFQRGESASHFGREIGLMYMHAHLRWAEALAHLGRAEAFFEALQRAHPIGLQALVPQAAPRQANCYHSSSDAAFADRVQAQEHYERIARGEVVLEGGWRIYSSGAGIGFRLIVQALLGLRLHADVLGVDPVLPTALDGLRAELRLYGHAVQLHYRVGPLGHGPRSVTLDGEALALQPGHNRYRRPGVWIDAVLLRARLAAGATRLDITLG